MKIVEVLTKVGLEGIGMNVGLCMLYYPYYTNNWSIEIILRIIGYIIMVVCALEFFRSLAVITFKK